MTVAELIDVLKEREPDESVYIGLRGELYSIDETSFPVGWDGVPTGGLVLVGVE